VGVTGILSPNDLDTIFSNVATIFEIHKNLLQDISHIKDKERAQSTILSAPQPELIHLRLDAILPFPSSPFRCFAAAILAGKSFGDSLKAFIPFLKMYTVVRESLYATCAPYLLLTDTRTRTRTRTHPHAQYINAFDDANKRIGELMNTSKKFAAYLQGLTLGFRSHTGLCLRLPLTPHCN